VSGPAAIGQGSPWRFARRRQPVNLAYQAARTGLAFRHRHEQGILRLAGKDRLTWLNGLVTNEVVNQSGCYAAWLTPQGRMITDLFVVHGDDDTLLEVPAPLSATLAARLDALIFAEDARVADASSEVQALEILGRDAGSGLDAVEHSMPPGVRCPSRHVDKPASGVVTYVPVRQLAGALEALTHHGGIPIDDVTAEILRVEAGIPRFLVDIGEDTIPLEAGLDHAISHTKGCYVGQEVIVRIRDRAHGRVARHLTGLRFDRGDVPATNQGVLLDSRQVGRLTSAVESPALAAPIGLAMLHRDASTPGTHVTLDSGRVGVTCKLPFVTTS
jgi:folate-binding protein YgfZ